MAAVAVWGDTPDAERLAALRDLRDGKIQVVFSVDLFNEGVDVPAIDTILMLRPTESATLFLQRLGRGLRMAPGKTVCTVLDFVGLHRREFRLDQRYRALLGGSRAELEHAVEARFPFLPAGCHLELDRVARDIVLRSIRDAIPSTWRTKVAELRAAASSRPAITMAEYLIETGLEVGDVYAGNRTWSALREAADLPTAAAGPHEKSLRRGIGRMLHVDDRQRIDAYLQMLNAPGRPQVDIMSALEQRLARMLVSNLADQVISTPMPLQAAIDLVWAHPQVVEELRELLTALGGHPGHVQRQALPGVPLQIHGQYSRIEILAAVGVGGDAKTPCLAGHGPTTGRFGSLVPRPTYSTRVSGRWP